MRWVLAALLLVPLAEVALLIATGRAIGFGWTLGLLVALVVLGAVLVRREGARTWRALQQASAAGRMPGKELLDAGLVMAGGVLLLLPGFLTDIVGLFLVLPFTRPLTRGWLQRLIRSRVLVVARPGDTSRGAPAAGSVIEGEIVEEDPPGR